MTPRLIAAAFALVASLASSASWANLIVNGDFETPGVPDSPGYIYRTGTQLTGWTITTPNNGEPHFSTFYRPVGGGSQALQLEETLGGISDAISQAITTTIGLNYFVSFDLSAYDAAGGHVRVTIDGIPVGVFDGTDAAYVTHTFFFNAVGTSTTLGFEHTGAIRTYPHLDNIVADVPEPGSLALLGIALAAFGAGRRRKQA